MSSFTLKNGRIVDIDAVAPVIHKDAGTDTTNERRSFSGDYSNATREDAQTGHLLVAAASRYDVDRGHTLPYATCRDCGATYDPSKGSCGCHDNASE